MGEYILCSTTRDMETSECNKFHLFKLWIDPNKYNHFLVNQGKSLRSLVTLWHKTGMAAVAAMVTAMAAMTIAMAAVATMATAIATVAAAAAVAVVAMATAMVAATTAQQSTKRRQRRRQWWQRRLQIRTQWRVVGGSFLHKSVEEIVNHWWYLVLYQEYFVL